MNPSELTTSPPSMQTTEKCLGVAESAPMDDDNAMNSSSNNKKKRQRTTPNTPKHIIEWMSQLTDEQLETEFLKEKKRRYNRKRSLQEVNVMMDNSSNNNNSTQKKPRSSDTAKKVSGSSPAATSIGGPNYEPFMLPPVPVTVGLRFNPFEGYGPPNYQQPPPLSAPIFPSAADSYPTTTTVTTVPFLPSNPTTTASPPIVETNQNTPAAAVTMPNNQHHPQDCIPLADTVLPSLFTNTTAVTQTPLAPATMPNSHVQPATAPLPPPELPTPPPKQKRTRKKKNAPGNATTIVATATTPIPSPSQPKDAPPNKRGYRTKPRHTIDTWRENYEKMKAYRHEFGHSFVSTLYHDKKLADWYYRERTHWSHRMRTGDASTCTDEVIDLLVAVGMGDKNTGPFKAYDERWNEHYEALRAYRDKHGHLRVSAKENKELYIWVECQRKCFQRRQQQHATTTTPSGKKEQRLAALSDERLHKLIQLGLPLKKVTPTFDERLQQMARYQAEHGNTRVPVSYKGMDNLGRWVTSIKTAYYEGKVPAERIERLNAMGFDWSRRHIQSNWTKINL